MPTVSKHSAAALKRRLYPLADQNETARPQTWRRRLAAYLGRGLREISLWLLVVVALYLLVSLSSYAPQDPGWSYADPDNSLLENRGGRIGAWLASVLLHLFGLAAYLFPILIAWSAWLMFHPKLSYLAENLHVLTVRWIGFVLTLIAGTALFDLYAPHFPAPLPTDAMGNLLAGGILGQFLAKLAVFIFKTLTGVLVLLAMLVIGLSLFTGISWFVVMDRLGGLVLTIYRKLAPPARLRVPEPVAETSADADAAATAVAKTDLVTAEVVHPEPPPVNVQPPTADVATVPIATEIASSNITQGDAEQMAVESMWTEPRATGDTTTERPIISPLDALKIDSTSAQPSADLPPRRLEPRIDLTKLQALEAQDPLFAGPISDNTKPPTLAGNAHFSPTRD